MTTIEKLNELSTNFTDVYSETIIDAMVRILVRNYDTLANAKNITQDDWVNYGIKVAQIKLSFKTIFYDDNNFEKMSKKSVLSMLRINLSLRIIPFHQFGVNISI